MNRLERKHILFIYIKAVFSFQLFIGPILTLFYMKHFGLSFGQFCSLDATLFLMVAIFEIPSGYISDLFGRKRMLLFSQVMCLAAMVLFVLFPSFSGAFAGIMILGVFIPLGSGNASAILYEFFDKEGQVERYQEALGKSSSLSYIVTILATVLSGYLANKNILIPIVLDICFLAASIIFTIVLLHDHKEKELKKDSLKETLSFKTLFRSLGDLRNIQEIGRITPLFILGALLFAIFRVSFNFYQPIFINNSIDVQYFGVIFAVCNIVCSVTSYFSKKIIYFLGKEKLILFVLGLIGITSVFLLIVEGAVILVFIALFMQQFMRGLFSPFFSVKVNEYIPKNSGSRVTYISYFNLLTTITVSIAMYSISIASEAFSFNLAITMFGSVLIAAYIVFMGLHRKNSIVQVEENHAS